MEPLILIAEDDADIRALLRLYLEGEGFRVLEAEDGMQALALARENPPDMAILDIMMPHMNGFELTRALRKYSDVPILILSAKSQDNDKILGLNLGADDYIAKPFNPVEIVARVKAQLRRAARTGGNVLTVGELALNTDTIQLTKNGQSIPLTPMEYKILALLMRAPGRIFTKIQLYEGAVGPYFEGDDNTMTVHISKLRDKIEDDPRNPRYIITVRGLGYKIEK
ncbi:MAG TPA: response regulator transcription factor [Candidatus Flavonifractor merdipullorum]|mgnify:FL=1|uniref:Stage 0 sporulation protein A homolog n=1 Tax=Candidatus Flavonifractor merdipullorum TaxID=2838590 RepID=A0A9D1RSW8_9FIRM|nr:response regulator transcription factor [Candidatus Flavonifractor merdipullorum]